MTRKKLFQALSFLLYTIAVLHMLALYFFWYWSFWWIDIPMHFLAGFWVGGIVLWFYFFPEKTATRRFVRPVFVYILPLGAVVAIGLLWELFEFSLDTFITLEHNDLLDTVSDLGMDIAGAFTASLYLSRAYRLSVDPGKKTASE